MAVLFVPMLLGEAGEFAVVRKWRQSTIQAQSAARKCPASTIVSGKAFQAKEGRVCIRHRWNGDVEDLSGADETIH